MANNWPFCYNSSPGRITKLIKDHKNIKEKQLAINFKVMLEQKLKWQIREEKVVCLFTCMYTHDS